jgi:DNA-binding MarR family transcriptional regulator
MGLARQSVQRTTDLLAAEGLVEYVENPAHRRAKLVQLSERGQTFLRELAPRQARWSNTLARSIGFTEADIRRAYDVVRSIRTELEQGQRHATTFEASRKRRGTGDAAGDGRRRESR